MGPGKVLTQACWLLVRVSGRTGAYCGGVVMSQGGSVTASLSGRRCPAGATDLQRFKLEGV